MRRLLAGIALLWGPAAEAEDIIHILHPRAFYVESPEASLQGTVDLPSVTRVNVRVQPFAGEDLKSVKDISLDVRGGSFQGTLSLPPGLHLVTVETPAQAVRSQISLFRPGEGASKQKGWGKSSPLVFSHPASLRVPDKSVRVEGIATGPVKWVTLLVLQNRHFQGLASSKTGLPSLERPRVYGFSVKDLRFGGTVELEEGANILLARPGLTPVPAEAVALRTVIYELSNPRLILNEPHFSPDQAVFSGEVRSPAREVRLKLTALGADPAGGVSLRLLLDKIVPKDAQGRFQFTLPLPASQEIKDFPLLKVAAGKDAASLLLTRWPLPVEK